MWTIVPRATRITESIPILYRRPGEDEWVQARVVNVSESGVLFGPTGLELGAAIEVMLSPPTNAASLATGKQVCVGEVVRVTGLGAAAAKYEECRFILES
jgi:hypothetical protein